MQNIQNYIPHISANDPELLCDGYVDGGKELWFDAPMKLKEISCKYCDGAQMHSAILNDGTQNSHLRMAFCTKVLCPRPREKKIAEKVPQKIDWTIFGIPQDYQDKSLDNFNFSREEGKQEAMKFTTSLTRQCMVFSGTVRTGKTHMSIALGKDWHERVGLPVYFTTHSAIYFELVEAMKTHDQQKVIEKYEKIPFLIIDDLGVLRGTPMELDLTYELISRRLVRRCKTIITTNCTDEELTAQYGPRLMARLGEKAEIKRFHSKRTPMPYVAAC